MVLGIGMKPNPLRPLRPHRAQRLVEQERPQALPLKGWNQPEMDEFDGRLSDIVELAEASGLAIDAQDMDMRRGAGQHRFEFRPGHAQTLIPLHRSADRSVEIEIAGQIKPFARDGSAG